MPVTHEEGDRYPLRPPVLEASMKEDYTPKIPKDKLEHGAYYKGRCRNATEARWHAEKEVFIHWRTKFNETFLEEISCPEDELMFDVFFTEEKIEVPTKEIPFK
jgi:hypothetical protein